VSPHLPSGPLSRVSSALALTLATAAVAAEPGTARFTFATQTLQVPAGFTAELVAGPPLVNRPISIAFDERGRLYATDSSGLSERAPVQFEKKPHRIVRLEDTDGDGRFDRSVVFAPPLETDRHRRRRRRGRAGRVVRRPDADRLRQ